MNGQTIFKVTKVLTGYGLAGFYFWFSFQVLRELPIKGSHLAVCVLYMSVLESFWLLFEAFHIEQRRILDLVYGQLFGAACANIFFGLFLYSIEEIEYGLLIRVFFVLFLTEAATGVFWATFFFYFFVRNQSFKNALFVYGERENPGEFAEKNNKMNGYFKIQKAVHFREGLDKILSHIRKYEAVYLGDIPYTERNQIMKECVKSGVDCYSIPKISDIYIQNTTTLRLHDKVLFKFPKGSLTPGQRAAKRILDILVSFILLVFSLPIMAVIILCILGEDGGPVWYVQDRVTIGGRPFKMLKFRSMRKDAEKDGPRLAVRDDSRITRTGKLIRNLHFDELPQLFNVIKGDMSLVGPRPERKEFIEEYSRIIPEFRERLKVRGGLTGYAQIYGKYNTGPEDKTKYDLIYIYNYSLRMDVRLLFLTVRILFQKENTEGVDSGQKSAAKKM